MNSVQMEAVALYDYHATRDDELSFAKDSILKVLSRDVKEEPYWYMGEEDGKQGLIPPNFIRMKPHDWFHGRITRAD